MLKDKKIKPLDVFNYLQNKNYKKKTLYLNKALYF